MKRLTGRQWTHLGLAVAGAALLGVETNALTNREESDTISARAHDVIIDYPVVAALLVAPVVHFATPTRRPGEALPLWQGAGLALLAGTALGLVWPRYDRSRLDVD